MTAGRETKCGSLMKYRAMAVIAVAMLVALTAAASDAQARGDRAEQAENCLLLQEQFEKAITKKSKSSKAEEARKIADDGIRRCHGGASKFGVDLLSEALQKIGEVPRAD